MLQPRTTTYIVSMKLPLLIFRIEFICSDSIANLYNAICIVLEADACLSERNKLACTSSESHVLNERR